LVALVPDVILANASPAVAAALRPRSEPEHLNVIGIARHVDQEGRAIYLKSINDNSTRALCSRINALRQAFSMRGRQVSQSFTFSS
jgi:hypothetical protein